MVSPYTKSSRWFLFTVEGFTLDDVLLRIQSVKPLYAQWWYEGSSVVGYLHFSTTRAIPLKKSWIYSATFTLASKASVLARFPEGPAQGALFYGESPVVDWPALSKVDVHLLQSQYENYIQASESLVSAPSSLSKVLEGLKTRKVAYQLPSSNTISALLIELMLTDDAAFVSRYESSDFVDRAILSELSRLFVDCSFDPALLLAKLRPVRLGRNTKINLL